MEKCPACGRMTAERNHYTRKLICYSRDCGFAEDVIKLDTKDPKYVDFVREAVGLKSLKYCSKHRTIVMPYNGEMPCCLSERVKELEKRLLDMPITRKTTS